MFTMIEMYNDGEEINHHGFKRSVGGKMEDKHDENVRGFKIEY